MKTNATNVKGNSPENQPDIIADDVAILYVGFVASLDDLKRRAIKLFQPESVRNVIKKQFNLQCKNHNLAKKIRNFLNFLEKKLINILSANVKN